MGADCLMPQVARPRTKSDGSLFTIDDREYWHRERDGGIRRNEVIHMDYPKMLYRGRPREKDYGEPDTLIVESGREEQEAAKLGWVDHPAKALVAADKEQDAVAKAAAEAAHSAQKLSPKAKAEYDEESASNPEHVTDVDAKRNKK